jgi:hypothetical protein
MSVLRKERDEMMERLLLMSFNSRVDYCNFQLTLLHNSVISLFIISPLSNGCFENSTKYKYFGVTVIIKIKFARKLTTDYIWRTLFLPV